MSAGNLAYVPQLGSMTNDVSGLSSCRLHEKDNTSVAAVRETLTYNSDFKWLPPIVSRLKDLLQLDADWDSYGAQPVRPESAKTVVELLYNLMSGDTPIPALIPTPDGHVQLEWHTKGIDLEVDIENPALFHVSYEDEETKEEWEGDLQYDVTRLVTFIRELTNR